MENNLRFRRTKMTDIKWESSSISYYYIYTFSKYIFFNIRERVKCIIQQPIFLFLMYYSEVHYLFSYHVLPPLINQAFSPWLLPIFLQQRNAHSFAQCPMSQRQQFYPTRLNCIAVSFQGIFETRRYRVRARTGMVAGNGNDPIMHHLDRFKMPRPVLKKGNLRPMSKKSWGDRYR